MFAKRSFVSIQAGIDPKFIFWLSFVFENCQLKTNILEFETLWKKENTYVSSIGEYLDWLSLLKILAISLLLELEASLSWGVGTVDMLSGLYTGGVIEDSWRCNLLTVCVNLSGYNWLR